MTHSNVLIVGAGPTGLVLALWLTKFGVKVRIIDKTAEPGTTSRALAVQARTLELYRQLGLADVLLERAHKTPAVNLWTKGARAARVSFRDIGVGLTPYPYMTIFPQDEHEGLLIERLETFGIAVERRTELISFRQEGGFVTARLRRPDDSEEICEAAYIAGCDGARSVVRSTIGADFTGDAYRQLFYVANVEAEGQPVDGELHIDLDEADFLAVFPLAGRGRARLVGTVRDERADHANTLKFEDISDRAIKHLKIAVSRVNWFSTYHVHHRVASRFRKGRAFILGDAAHIHSPAGGQGMNTGIADAINLAWKIDMVLGGWAPDSLLDSYEAERIGFARRLVATTDRAFTMATKQGRLADIVRTRVAPLVISIVAKFKAARVFLFKTVSQISLNYRGSPLSGGKAGFVRGGDRLPWVRAADGDNFASAAGMTWQVHVYGSATPELTQWCAAHNLPLHLFGWRSAYGKAGFARNALYLLRPDSYVALADPSGSVKVLEQYATRQKLNIAR